tara:strand:+ start:66 stop:293 length:228 start_codon:yes stop_codon:yes gene_type:complete
MKKLIIISFFLLLNNCSFNKNSQFWSENSNNKKTFQKELERIMIKSNDLLSLSFDEYQIYIDEYNKKTKYPNISK